MYLKKIVISGFKSFADRVVLTFDSRHITGIVGPNGSGKSNVIDAVRWVMGEQNAKMLRGDKATDIIFSGSEKRKAQSLAEVSLYFDNREASVFCPPEYRHEEEVCLTRRIYLDGQREYLINQKPSRLRDIVGFFAYTGLGGRSYSMIQQGQVDRILQAKPEQIREILEEAAGTSIFKKRRAETAKKLEHTQTNLSRVDDILGELHRQLDALSTQVEKAKRWNALTELLKEQETQLLEHSHKLHSKKLQDVAKTLEEEDLREVAVRSHLNDFESRLVAVKRDLEESDPDLARLTEEISSLRERIASHEASLLNTIKLVEGGGTQLESLAAELQNDESNLVVLRKQVDETSRSLDGIEDEAHKLRELDEEWTYRKDLQQEEAVVLERNVDNLKEELVGLDKTITASELRLESLEKDLARAQATESEANNALNSYREQSSQSRILLDSAQVRAKSAQRHLDDHLARKGRVEVKLKEVDEKIVLSRSRADQHREKLLEVRAQIGSLEELLASGTDVKSALIAINRRHDFQQELRCLSDAIRLNDNCEQLDPSALRAFEHWAERLVLLDASRLELVSSAAVEAELPPVPLTVLDERVARLDSRTVDECGLTSVTQFVEFSDQRLRPAMVEGVAYFQVGLLDRDIVKRDALKGVVIFFSDGSVFSGGRDFCIGTMSGQGSLLRQQRLEELRSSESTLSERTQAQQEKLTTLEADRQEATSQLAVLDAEILEGNKSVIEAFSRLQDAKNASANQQDKISGLQAEAESARRLCEECLEHRAQVDEQLVTLRAQAVNGKRALDDAKIELDDALSGREEEKRQHEQVRFDLANIDNKRQTLTQAHELAVTQLEVLQGKFTRQSKEYETLKRNIASAQTDRHRLESEIAELVARRGTCEDELATRRDANSQLLTELRALEGKIQESNRILAKCQKTKSSAALEAERARVVLDSLAEQALEKYQLRFSDQDLEVDPDFRPDVVSKQLAADRQEFEALGPVNMMALEEHEEINERKEFMGGQREEILATMDLLQTAVEEIEGKSASKFMETFRLLNEEFGALFPILFPRGEGHIQLTDPDHPLDAGVEIMVRLPGKKRQSMRLFSGGEKALTAIALIFALLKSKPTPFCFLDEVDAPLDETNVSRYNNLLDSLSDRFQFIVITHRRKTMEVLDTLYGVTMQEPGVSKVVGVDLGKALPTHLQKAFTDVPRPPQTAAH